MNKKLRCIKRMLEFDRYYEFTEWLVEYKFASTEDIKDLERDLERAEFIYTTLAQALKDEKLQLFDFEWTLLPLETIKITCVTETTKKDFTYGI